MESMSNKASKDEKKRDEILKRMLNTPPTPHVKKSETESAEQKKTEGRKR